jgi:DNA-binding transcriptional ArsR family regulator
VAAPALSVLRDADAAASLLQPDRLRLLRELAEPDSASGLARRLKLPRQRINYHLRELERQGLLEVVAERRKGNCIERVLRASARAYVVSPEALGPLGADPAGVADQTSAAYLVSLAARTIRDLAGLTDRARREEKRLATFALDTEIRFASAADRAAFANDLTAAVAALAARYHAAAAPAGRSFRVVVGAYPATRAKESTS